MTDEPRPDLREQSSDEQRRTMLRAISGYAGPVIADLAARWSERWTEDQFIAQWNKTLGDLITAVRREETDAKQAEVDGLRAQLDALIAACDAEYAPPPDSRPAGLPALLDFVAERMTPMSPEEELAGYKRQAAWSHYMATKFNGTVWDLRTEVTGLRGAKRAAAGFLRDTAERVEQGRTVNAQALRAAATALDEITGGQQ